MNNIKYLEKTMKEYKIGILIWTSFIGLGAVVGSCMFFIDPNNGFTMGAILPLMREKLPFGDVLFSDFIFSGISLLIINGISNISAFVLILRNKKVGYILGYIFGITLMLWICIQFYVFYPKIYLIDVLFFVFGLLQFIIGYLAYVNYQELNFIFNEGDYKDISGDSNTLVVYFSRMGYTKKLAYEKANELKAEILEVRALEKIAGRCGFWWCGRFAMHRWPMNISLSSELNLSKYDTVYIYTPIWAFSISSPIRKFIIMYQKDLEKINNINMVFVHYMGVQIKSAKKETAKLLSNIKTYEEYSNHIGKFKYIEKR